MKLAYNCGGIFGGVFSSCRIYKDGSFALCEAECSDGSAFPFSDYDKLIAIPGLTDMHVHFREPGFSYKETVATGSAAAAASGYTLVCTMPNVSPPPDCERGIREQLSLIEKDSRIRILPYSCITVGQAGDRVVDFDEMVRFTHIFSDDGHGVQSDAVMLEAMKQAAARGCLIAAHCEDNSLLHGGYIHAGEYAAAHGHAGICSESEYGQIARDIELVRQTGCRYHVCHVSCRESVDIIRRAKAEGLPVSCETAPHYLLLSDRELREDGRFKMNPPLRSEDDRLALIAGVADGTIDVIATDHAPHSAQEKSRGLRDSAMGIVGLETAFPLLYTYLVKPGIITLNKLVALMSDNPRAILGQPPKKDDFAVFDLGRKYTVDPERFLSKGRATPFAGREVYGKNILTVMGGKIVWQEEK